MSTRRLDWFVVSHCDQLEAILFDLHCEHGDEPPAPDEVEAWCARHPEHTRTIREHVAAWVRCDLARNRVPLHYRHAAGITTASRD